MKVFLHQHLTTRRGFTFKPASGCSCDDYYIRHFGNGERVLIEHSKCVHNGKRLVRKTSCPVIMMHLKGDQLLDTLGTVPRVAREFDELLKSRGLLPEELEVGMRG